MEYYQNTARYRAIYYFFNHVMRGAFDKILPIHRCLIAEKTGSFGSLPCSSSETDAILGAIRRMNQHWPGTFVPVNPIDTNPDDRLTVLWNMNIMAIWPRNLDDPPSISEVYRVAIGDKNELSNT